MMHIGLWLTCVSLCFSVGALAQAPEPLPKTINDIVAQLKSLKPDDMILAEAAAALASEAPANTDRAGLVTYYLKRSRANRVSGTVEAMLADARKAAELASGLNNRLEWESLAELSNAEAWGGNFLNAIKAKEQLAKVREFGREQGWALGGHAGSAILSGRLGDIDRAENSLRHAEGILSSLRVERDWFTMRSEWTATVERSRGNVLSAIGKYAEAEVALREAMLRTDESIEMNRRLNYTAPVFLESQRENVENELAIVLVKLGRLQEAEWHARSSLQRMLRRVAGNAPQLPYNLTALIIVLYHEGRYAESRSLAAIARELLAQSGAQATARGFSILSRHEGSSLVALGQYSSALRRYVSAYTGLASDPDLQRVLGGGTLIGRWH